MQKSLEKQSDLSTAPIPEGNKRREAGLVSEYSTVWSEDQKVSEAKTMCQMDVAFQHGHLGTWGTH